MSAETRGEYRVLFTRLQDTAWYQGLSGAAQNVHRALKLKLPPHGIAICYTGELVPRCGRDATIESVERALEELIAVGAVRREHNVIWLVLGGLDDEPNMTPKSQWTRKGVQKRVASIPPCPLVDAFRAAYPDWFRDDTHTRGITTPSDAVAEGVSTGVSGPPLRGSGYSDVSVSATVSDDVTVSRDDAGKGGDAERERRQAEVRAQYQTVIDTFRLVREWVGEPDHVDVNRRDILARVLSRVMRADGAEPIDAVTYAGYIEAALEGSGAPGGRPVSGANVQLNLSDWLAKRSAVEPRLFRRFLTGADAQEERPARNAGARVSQGRAGSPAPATAKPGGGSGKLKSM